LQVEHPVTEEITGVDLVEWQLRVASGEPLPKRQEELSINGWAMEARLYAEDAENGFLPSPGRVDRLLFDYRARTETGVEEGDTVSPFYDPMIAKVICHGPDREGARSQLVSWIDNSFVVPLKTNKAFLYACLSHNQFINGDVDTGLIEQSSSTLTAIAPPSPLVLAAAGERFRRDWLDNTDWDTRAFNEGLFGFRMNAPAKQSINVYTNGQLFKAEATTKQVSGGLCSDRERDGTIIVTERGHSYFFSTARPASSAGGAIGDGAILSPMPGRIIAVEVGQGQSVTKGQKLLTLEAMKMEHSLTAPFDGVVAELNAEAGAQVPVEVLLVRIQPVEET
jgi:3-methylcrotonyl-CoA carboxylase alpha subunit